ncbi:MAG: hypothetical protein HY802_07205 [Methanobacterium sp.]|nr:hypothetical protein [Methanobacterium sp.]
MTGIFENGAYSWTAVMNDGRSTTSVDTTNGGHVSYTLLGYTAAIEYDASITDLDGSSNGGSEQTGPGDGQSSTSTGSGSGSGSGSGGSSGSGASSGSASTVGATAALSAAGSSGSSCQEDCSKTVQELIVDDMTKNPSIWAILGVILLLVLVLGGYYRKDLMNMIKKSKK